MKAERRYDIDWLRVIAIGLLLIYHISIVFQPWALFIAFIQSKESLEMLWKPMSMLNVWRIPLLFYVSGMGLYFAMRKRTWQQLLLERTKRILLPFVFGIVAIVPLHMMLFQKFYNLPVSYQLHQGHLWFLGNIFIYVLLLFPIFFYLKKHANGTFQKRLSKLMQYPITPCVIALFFVVEVELIAPQQFSLYAETWHGFFMGLLAFFFGYIVVYSGQNFWNMVLKWKWLYLGVGIILFSIRMIQFGSEIPGYVFAIESNAWIFGLFGLSYTYLNKPSKTLSYLSKAAYPIYIIHMFVLYAVSSFVLPLSLNGYLKFTSIVLFTFLGCYGIYEICIRRINFIKPLFGLQATFKKNNPIDHLKSMKYKTTTSHQNTKINK